MWPVCAHQKGILIYMTFKKLSFGSYITIDKDCRNIPMEFIEFFKLLVSNLEQCVLDF